MPDRPLTQLTLARLREFYREPAAVFWVYGFPLLLALVLGFAFTERPVEAVPVDLAADGPPELVEKLRQRLAADPRIKLEVRPAAEARERLRTNRTGLVVTPTDAAPGWAYTLDPNRPESVLAKAAAEGALLRPEGTATPAETTLDLPGGRYIDFLIPGLLGTNLMGGGLWGVGFVVVDMRVRKLLKRFLATPMRRSHFLLSLMLSRILFTLVEVVLLVAFARLVFGVRVQGDPTAFAALVVAGGFAFAGVGLLVACRAKTIETVSGLMNAVMLPMYLLSGVFFAYDKFPDVVQPAIRALPLTTLIDGLRAVVNDAAGWGAAWRPCLVLTAWAGVCFAVALRLFRWR
jgi:ABC-type multidrug transport system permease subunit